MRKNDSKNIIEDLKKLKECNSADSTKNVYLNKCCEDIKRNENTENKDKLLNILNKIKIYCNNILLTQSLFLNECNKIIEQKYYKILQNVINKCKNV